MAELGTNVDKIGTVSADSLHWLRARWARIVAAPDHVMEQLAYVRAMRQVGIKILMTFDHDAYRAFGAIDDPATWRQAANWGKVVYGPAKQSGPLIDAIEPVNEPDGEGFESSPAAKAVVNGMLAAHRNAWGTGMTIVGCATSSGQTDWYDGIEMGILDKLSFHPYAQWSPESLMEMIDRHAALGKMLWISEIGIPTANDDEQTAFVTMALETINKHPMVEVCTYFCGHHYENWGLSRADGTWRPAAKVFKQMAKAPPDPPAPPQPPNPYTYVLGFKAWHDAEPSLIGDPLSNERNTGWPGWQIQPTTTGVLNWHEGNGHVFVQHDGRVFQWAEDWGASVEVPA